MILRALYEYYHRCDNVAPEGMEYKEIAFLIIINKEGDFLGIEDCRIDKKRCSTFLVTKTVKRSGSKSGLFPCLLWDNTRFVLGLPKDGNANPEGQYIDAFKQKVRELSEKYPKSTGLCSVNRFYTKYPDKDLSSLFEKDLLGKDLLETTKNVSFRVQGDLHIVAEDPVLIEEVQGSKVNVIDGDVNGKVCLVTGEKGEISRIHSKTPLPGSTFSSLVSFQKSSGFDSYGKEQAYNASVSVEAEFAYTTAMNMMLQRESHNKFSIGTRTFLFWASSNSEAAKASEDVLFSLFAFISSSHWETKFLYSSSLSTFIFSVDFLSRIFINS